MSSFKFKVILSLVFTLSAFSWGSEEFNENKCKCFSVQITDEISLSTTINSYEMDESAVTLIYEFKL